MAAGILLVVSIVRYGIEATTSGETVAWDSTGVVSDLLEDSRQKQADDEERRRPLAEGEAVDPNRASEATLDRLPGVGPGLASAIVGERDAGGGFTAPEDLLRVRGIGPATLDRLRPRLDFAGGVPARLRGPPSHTTRDTGGRSDNRAREADRRIDVNRADSAALVDLPGIGPALARRIIAARREASFRRPEDLLRVRGIGPATVERLRGAVRVGPARRP